MRGGNSGKYLIKKEREMFMYSQVIKLTNEADYKLVMEFMKANNIQVVVDSAYSLFLEEEAENRLDNFLEDNDMDIDEDVFAEAVSELTDEFYRSDIVDDERAVMVSDEFLQDFFESKGFEF